MACIVVTRNGEGGAWSFRSLAEARCHPIPQMDDVYATDPATLIAQYGRYGMEPLLRLAEGRERAALTDATENWKSAPAHVGLDPHAEQKFWNLLRHAARVPPSSAEEIVRIVREDRQAREGRTLKSRPGPDGWFVSVPPTLPKTGEVSMANKETKSVPSRRKYSDAAVITLLVEKNPKRDGSKAHDRFALYTNGLTVKDYIANGGTSGDLAYDVAHDYIKVEEPEAA